MSRRQTVPRKGTSGRRLSKGPEVDCSWGLWGTVKGPLGLEQRMGRGTDFCCVGVFYTTFVLPHVPLPTAFVTDLICWALVGCLLCPARFCCPLVLEWGPGPVVGPGDHTFLVSCWNLVEVSKLELVVGLHFQCSAQRRRPTRGWRALQKPMGPDTGPCGPCRAGQGFWCHVTMELGLALRVLGSHAWWWSMGLNPLGLNQVWGVV